MIKGKTDDFVQGNSFKFTELKKVSEERKGRACVNCGRYKLNEYFTEDNEDCRTCDKKSTLKYGR